MQEPELEMSDDVVKVEMGKPAAVKLVHAATGLTPRFENGAVNHVAGMLAPAMHAMPCSTMVICFDLQLQCHYLHLLASCGEWEHRSPTWPRLS